MPTTQDLDYAFVIATALEKTISCRTDVRVINDASLSFRNDASCEISLVVIECQAHLFFLERMWDESLDFRPVPRAHLKELA